KSIATLGARLAHGTTWPGEAVWYIGWKSKGAVVQSVWLALCTKPFAPLATIVPLVAVVRSSILVSRPLAVSLIVTTMVSPLFMKSLGPPGVPSVVTKAAVVGSRQLAIWKAVASCSVLICRRAHHCVSEPQVRPGG